MRERIQCVIEAGAEQEVPPRVAKKYKNKNIDK